jgi:hypothetical protein
VWVQGEGVAAEPAVLLELRALEVAVGAAVQLLISGYFQQTFLEQ